MKKKIINLFAVLITLLTVTSCTYNEEENPNQVSDFDTTITNSVADQHGVFQEAKTFSIPNYVVHLGEDDKQQKHETTSTDQVIIDQAKKNMIEAGYTLIEEGSTEKPDLVVLPYSLDVTVVGSVNYYPGYWPSYWDGYWGGYWGWYGYGYPYYGYGMTSYYAYDQGTVILEITDNSGVQSKTGENQVPVIWQGITNGTQTNIADNQSRIKKNIDQMFIQSPYIYAN